MQHTIKNTAMQEHPKKTQKVYNLNGIIHLPHYQHEGVFVSPADKIGKIESHLINQGATAQQMHLWDRSY